MRSAYPPRPPQFAPRCRSSNTPAKLHFDRAVLDAAGHRQRATRRTWVAGLTDREIEVLRLLARGHSNRQMAALLHVSERTFHHHIEHIYDKIDVSTRAGATLFAMHHNLLSDLDDAQK